MENDPETRSAFFDVSGTISTIDLTDGFRVTFENGDIVHLRPSGNAPEFRSYAESSSQADAQTLLSLYLNKLQNTLS